MNWLKAIGARIKADNLKLARYARGFVLWVSAVSVQVVGAGIEVASTWTLREWAKRFAIAALFGSAGLITAGQRNPPAAGTP